MVDSYKSSMKNQYPPGTDGIFSYIESRGGRFPATLFFGLQMFLKKYFSKPLTVEMVEEAKAFFELHGEPFPYEDWMYIVNDLEGKLPIVIKAVPEGTLVPTHNVLVTIENTDPKCFWLTTWLETALLRAVWYPTTVCTQSYYIRKEIEKWVDDASFKLHDFGARGVNSSESAQIGGAAHLVNFKGSDTIEGIWAANHYYNHPMAGFSIPAAEHSTITSWGRENEVDAYRNMLKQFAKPGSLVAVVSDSYDIYNAVENLWCKELKDEVLASGATVVIRPDSGDPATVVTEVLDRLWDTFGGTFDSLKGKILNPAVRVIQGDGINMDSIQDILNTVCGMHGFSAENITFGMGGKLLQADIDRDTQAFAMKCSAAKINGQWRDVFKDPITDRSKASKKGKLGLYRSNLNGDWVTCTHNQITDDLGPNELREVYRDGKLLIDDNLETIRQRAHG
jgi:nicotinamide phosphoribosyltransferase